jgi:hypothetical protein
MPLPDPHQPAPTLDYHIPTAARPFSKPQLILGLILSFLATAASVFLGILFSLGADNGLPLLLIAADILVINLWAALAYRSPARRGLAIGLWTGFALAAIVEGACFTGMR